ncbi:MAG: DUF6247 family protein [Pseudonocardiaceae bacterium]
MSLLATSAEFASFADVAPAQLREVIVEEDREAFDEQYRAALTAAAETLSLDELECFLVHWRQPRRRDPGHQPRLCRLASATAAEHLIQRDRL